MLSASDQILVSQLAILIAALMAYRSLTIYSADIILALAFLASTVHLSSFNFLAEELRQRPRITAIRIFLIWCASLMLSAGLILQISDHWRAHIFVACAAKDIKITRGLSQEVLNFVPVLYVFGETCVVTWRLSGQPSRDRRETQVAEVGGTEKNESETLSARTQLYSKMPSSPTDIELDPLDGSSDRRRSVETSLEETPDITFSTPTDPQEEHEDKPSTTPPSGEVPQPSLWISLWRYGGISASEKSKHLTKRLKEMASDLQPRVPHGSPWRLGVAHWFLATWWASAECTASFMANILGLLFGTIYGVGSVFAARDALRNMKIDKNEMGFGQIIPIAMLILPIMAAMQSISGENKASISRKVANLE